MVKEVVSTDRIFTEKFGRNPPFSQDCRVDASERNQVAESDL